MKLVAHGDKFLPLSELHTLTIMSLSSPLAVVQSSVIEC